MATRRTFTARTDTFMGVAKSADTFVLNTDAHLSTRDKAVGGNSTLAKFDDAFEINATGTVSLAQTGRLSGVEKITVNKAGVSLLLAANMAETARLKTLTVTTTAASGVDTIDASKLKATHHLKFNGGKVADTVLGGAGSDSIDGGIGNDFVIGGRGGDKLYGRTGTDTLSYVTSAAAVTVNLATNKAKGGDAAGDTISGFENIVGSQKNDVLIGNSSANTVRDNGGIDNVSTDAGADTVFVGLGNDSFNGGSGTDTLDFSGATTVTGINLITGKATGGLGSDSFSGFEIIVGSKLHDTITAAGKGADIRAGAGNDTVFSGIGKFGSDDTLDGGAGTDTLSYANYNNNLVGISFGLPNGFVSGIGIDSVKNFEIYLGSNFGDSFLGTAAAETFGGLGGNDLAEGGGGADRLDGGSGLNTLTYANSADGITINLATGAGSGGDAAGDSVANFQNVVGSTSGDRIIGTLGDNVITGGRSSDTLTGNGGNDRFVYTQELMGRPPGVRMDLITDFSVGDKIDLSDIDADKNTVGNQAFRFDGFSASGANSGTAASLVYTHFSGFTYIYLDVDGGGFGGASDLEIALPGQGTLTAGDFIL
jgi:Ca2+-binding RTX toxin-like protein